MKKLDLTLLFRSQNPFPQAAVAANNYHQQQQQHPAAQAHPAQQQQPQQQPRQQQQPPQYRPQPYSNPSQPTRALEASGPALRRHERRRLPGSSGDPGAAPPNGGSLPESELFRSLKEVERRLDAALASRAGLLRDALQSASGVASSQGTRRLRVYARVDVEPGDENEGEQTANPARWVLSLWGRVLSVAEAEGLGEWERGDCASAAPPPPAAADPFLSAGNSTLSGPPPLPRLKPFLAHVRKLKIELRSASGAEGREKKAAEEGEGASEAAAGAEAGANSSSAPSVLTWVRTSHEGGTRDLKDKVTVRRAGIDDVDATITLEVDGVSERVLPDAALAAAAGVSASVPDTRANLLRALWASIAQQGLYARDEPNTVSLDPGTPLAAVFGGAAAKVGAGAVPAAIAAHARAVPAPSFSVRIRPREQVARAQSGCSSSIRAVPVTVVHDFELDTSASPAAAVASAVANAPVLPSSTTNDSGSSPVPSLADRLLAGGRGDPAVEAADAALSSALRRLREHSRRRAFLLGFASSPAAFIRALAAAQARELRAARGPAAAHAGALGGAGMRGSDVFSGSWVDEAAGRLLARTMAGGGS